MSFQRTSVAFLVIIVLVTTTTLLLGTFGFFNYRSERVRQWAKLRSELAADANQLSAGLSLPVWNFDRPQINKILDSVMENKMIYGVVIRLADATDVSGRIYGRARDEKWRVVVLEKEIPASGLLLEERDIVVSSGIIGRIKIFATPKFVEAELRKTLISAVSNILALDLILTLGLYLLLYRWVLKPLKQVESYAAAQSSGNLGAINISAKKFCGELESVRFSLEKMVNQIEARYAERRKAEDALRQSEERYRTLFEAAQDAIYLIEKDRIIDCNRSALRMFGYPRDKIVKEAFGKISIRRVSALVQPDGRESTGKAMEKLQAALAGVPQFFEWRARRFDGKEFDAEVSLNRFEVDSRVMVLAIVRDITDRKRAEEEIRKREALLVEAERIAHVGSYEWDVRTNQVYRSEELCRIFGVEPCDFQPTFQGYLERVHPEDRDKTRATIEGAFREGRPFEFEERIICPTGHVRILRSQGNWISDKEKKPWKLVGICQDITERKQAEEALRESEARYRSLVENVGEGVVVAVDDKLAYVNPAAIKLAGVKSAEELLGRSVMDFVHEDSRETVRSRRANMLRTGLPSPATEGKLVGPCGVIDAEWMGVPIHYEGKTAILNTIRNVTESKFAQGLLAGEKHVLECIAKRIPLPEVLNEICRFVEEVSPDLMTSILLLDPDGEKLWPAAAPKLPDCWTRAITPLPIGPAVGACGTAIYKKEMVLASDVATDPRWTAYPELLKLAIDCGLRACWSTPILSAKNEALGTFAMYYGKPRDPLPRELELIKQVSHLASVAIEHDRAAEALRRAHNEMEQRVQERTAELVRANERLEELDRLKSQFLASMSHELRTPLNSIIGFTGILQQGFAGPINDEQKKQLGLVAGSSKHLLSLINDLLDLSRIEAGKVDLDHAPFNFVEVVTEVIEVLKPMANQKNLRLVSKVPGPQIKMIGDRKRCFQILLNLANNAVKFTERGEIEIFVRTIGDRLWVCVSDTGIGIKPEQMGMLFEAFRQLDSSAKRVYEGTGLGLHLCRRLLDLMHGEISVESEFGRGSRFVFSLPLKQPAPHLQGA